MSFSESIDAIVAANSNSVVGKHATWERVRLEEIADILNGFPFESSRFTSDRSQTTPLVRIRDLRRGATETHYRGNFDPQYLIRDGDIIIGMDGDFNAVVWRGDTALLNQRVAKISPRTKLFDRRFLSYALPGYLTAINAHTSSITVKHLSSRTIAQIPLPLPAFHEQTRIADSLDELFSDLDVAVASIERAREKLGRYRASVLKAAVDGTLTTEWREEHPYVEPASQLLERILAERRGALEMEARTDSAKSRNRPARSSKATHKARAPLTAAGPMKLPSTWTWASLDELASLSGGVTKGQRLLPDAKARDVPYLRVANVQRGFLDLTEIKTIKATEDDIEALRLVPGDVLFNEGGDRDKLGRGWIWQGELDECIHQNHVFRARLASASVQPKFVSWCGNSYGQRWFMRAGKQSVNLASINLTVLRSFPVALPPAEEQEAIVEIVEDQLSIIDHLESELNAKLHTAQSLRQSILRHAFSGKLVPQDPNDEPASKLLERIAAERAARQSVPRRGKRSRKAT